MPGALASLLDPARDCEAPLGLQELRNAQEALDTHVRETMPLAQFFGGSGASSESIMHGLTTLSCLWRTEALRPLLTARHLSAELAALLHQLRTPDSGDPPSDDASAWCNQRIEALLEHEPSLALLEALIALLRQPGAPAWLRTACSTRLSQVVLRPDGVQSLLLSLCAHQPGEAAQAAAAQQAARLLGSVPARMEPHTYATRLAPQLLPLLSGGEESFEHLQATPHQDGASDEIEAQQQRVLRNAAALIVGTLARRQPEACNACVLRPLLAPLLVWGGDDASGASSSRGDIDDGRRSLRRVCHLLTASPPPPMCLCDTLLRGGALRPLLSVGLWAHTRHTAEHTTAVASMHMAGGARGASEPALIALAERGVEALLSLSSCGVTHLARLVACGHDESDSQPERVDERPPAPAPLELTPLMRYLTRRLNTRPAMVRPASALTALLLSSAMRALPRIATDEEPIASAPTDGPTAPPAQTDDGDVPARSVEAALVLLEHTSSEQLTAYLRDEPTPALELVRAALPAAVGLSAVLVGDAEQVAAASERLGLCIAVVQLLLPAAAKSENGSDSGASTVENTAKVVEGSSSSSGGADDGWTLLRAGLRELLPVLVAASSAPLLAAETRANALAASVGVATLRLANGGTVDVTDGGAGEHGDEGDEGERAELREAAEEMVGVHVPLRAKGLDTVRRLVQARRPLALSQLPLLIDLCEAQLHHEDSFVYQAAVNALETAATVAPSTVLPRLAALLLPEPAESGGAANVSRGCGSDEVIDAAAERRLKAAQAICQAVLRLGETLPPHAEQVMGALLIGSCDGQQPAVRSSCLACLAQVTATLRFALHPWAVEVLQVAAAALEGETDGEARRAACYLITTLVDSLGAEALVVLPAAQLAALHRRLRQVRDASTRGEGGEDSELWRHACAALEAMRALGLALAKGGRDAMRDDAAETISLDGLRLPPVEGYGPRVRVPGVGPKPIIEVMREAISHTN